MSEHRHEGDGHPPPDPIGLILAGGRGRRIGGAKAIVQLGGRPLISYPLAALRAVLTDVAIVAKSDTRLPIPPGAPVWIEPQHPRHPLVGILHALEQASGRPVVVCAADLPFVTPELIVRIAAADPSGGLAALAAYAGAVQPLVGCYQPDAAELLARALDRVCRGARLPLREAVAALCPRLLEVEHASELFNVNCAADLRQAAGLLAARRPPADGP